MSPVVATMILIVVTLVAAAVVGGFVFSLMGTFTSVALVSAGTPSCSGTPEVCAISLQNSGSGSVALEGTCTLRIDGNSTLATASIQSGSLEGGSSAVVDCTAPGSLHVPAGSSVVGWVNLQNGAEILFYGKAD